MTIDLSGMLEIQRDHAIASAIGKPEDEGALIAIFILGRAWQILKHRRGTGDNEARRILMAASDEVIAASEAAIQKRIDRFLSKDKQLVSARRFRYPMQVQR